VERWNGKVWLVQHTPSLKGVKASLESVSCPSSITCTAVGGAGVPYTVDDPGGPLVERWNGARWSLQRTPGFAGEETSISCGSATVCIATGSQTLVERGTRWSIAPTTALDNVYLSEVSCASATACVALPEHGATIGARWDGSTWKRQPIARPAGANDQLNGISCVSSRSCSAVGSYALGGGSLGLALAERWNGRRWSTQRARDLAGTTVSQLSAVSCTAPNACTAVGNYYDPAHGNVTLAERWDGTNWMIQPTPNPAGATTSDLIAVSCPSSTNCIAVGGYETARGQQPGFAESWNGTSWSIQSMPALPRGGQGLTSVSCGSPTACIAVGAYGWTVERWDGIRWSRPIAQPLGSGSGSLTGVSCTSPTACTAVGGTSSGLLAERWDGTTWSIEPIRNEGNDTLQSVSCTSLTACTAVGTNGSPLAESWDGTTWSIQPTPRPTTPVYQQLNSVSCTAASACTAIGNSNYGGSPLAMRWDGASWATQPTPNPPATTIYLTSVSCATPTSCFAVGNYSRAGKLDNEMLVEQWDGT
jgi:hypothetical protein